MVLNLERRSAQNSLVAQNQATTLVDTPNGGDEDMLFPLFRGGNICGCKRLYGLLHFFLQSGNTPLQIIFPGVRPGESPLNQGAF